MRISLVLLLCFVIVMVNSANTRVTRRRVTPTTGRNSTKVSAPKSAYAYLRSVRGKNSCARGSCPFWERHGRSFAALRCYAKQYQECTCLHRMCFSSCMFTPKVCNQEMVSCLRQICPRCMPTSASAMCAVYDSLAEQVANALSVFACYPCCPIVNNGVINNNQNGSSVLETTARLESSSILPITTTNGVFFTDSSGTDYFTEGEFTGGEYPSGTGEEGFPGTTQNIVNNGNGGGKYLNNGNGFINSNGNGIPNSNGNGFINSNGNGIPNSNGNGFINSNGNGIPNSNGNGFINSNGNGFINSNGNGIPNSNGNGFINGNGNGIPNSNGNGFINGNGNGIPNSNGNGFVNGNGNGIPNGNGNGASNGNGNNVVNGNGNGNGISGNCNIPNSYPGVVFPGSDLIFYNNNFPLRSQQALKQRVRQTIPATKRRLSTIRRTPVTSPRTQGVVTVRGNKVNSGVRKPVQTQKKPQTANRTKTYVPGASARRRGYRSGYSRPSRRYAYRPRLPPPVVPAGRAPGGAGLLAAILGPIGGLTGCLCCLMTIGVWGLFITAIPLTVFISRWLRDYRNRNGLNGAGELLAPQLLLLVLLVSAALGPIGGLAVCACCLIIIAIWGLFATTIALAVYTRRWADAIRQANGLNGGVEQLIFSQALLIGILCVYGFLGLRRALRSAN
ncbi:unnamed protein product [Rotaria sp. Silwood1]|nr:unnamed protein product [Rotaria sp. Silwood1]